MPKQGYQKLMRAEQAIRRAEKAIQDVTADDLVELGFGSFDVSDARKTAQNEVYRVIGHATALRIIREHLHNEYLR